MRSVQAIAIAVGILAAAPAPSSAAASAPAAGPTFTVGSSAGVDVYSQSNYSALVASTGGGFPSLSVAEPGLRLGLVAPDGKLEIAAQVGALVIASFDGMATLGGATLDGNYHFRSDADVSQYVGLHAGITGAGYESGEFRTSVGAQVGARRMVSSGHGAIRLELRGSLITSEYSQAPLTDLGLRVGYDLWFR